MKRWPKILLIVSLVANIFMIGAIAGGVWHWQHSADGGPRGGGRMRFADALPAPQADAFRKDIRSTMEAARPIAQAGRAARAEAARLFAQPQFDGTAVTAQLDRARTADMIMRTKFEHALVAFAATLPQDQRQKLANALKEGPLRRDRHR